MKWQPVVESVAWAIAIIIIVAIAAQCTTAEQGGVIW
jgi:hypothetical protein